MVTNADRFFLSHRIDLAKAAMAAGYRVSLMAAPSGEKNQAQIEASGVEFVPVELSRQGMNPRAEMKTLLELRRKYKIIKPSVIHHDTPKPVIYGTLAAWELRRCGVVNTVTGLGSMFTNLHRGSGVQSLIGQMYKTALRNPRCVTVFENPDDRELFLRLGWVSKDRHALVRGAGVDTDRFNAMPEPEGPITVVMPARLLLDKGAKEYALAGKLLKERSCPIRLAMVGDIDEGNPSSITQEQLDEWTQSGWVEAWGYQSDMPSVLARAHIVCLPSYREGLPKALIEGASAGRALVASDVTGCREMCLPGVTGLLVPPRDPVSLADALEKLVKSPELRRSLGRRGRALVLEHFSMKRVADAFLEAYERSYSLAHQRRYSTAALKEGSKEGA